MKCDAKWIRVLPWIVGVAILLALAGGPGCSIILPSHANLIDQAAGNAVAINAKVQTDANLPPYVRQWWANDANQWTYLSDWAHGRRPTPAGK
jgi:hypothetical protein